MLNHRNTIIVFLVIITGLILYDLRHDVPWYAYVITSVLFLSIEFYGAAYIGSGFHIKTICEGKDQSKNIALTFDDGPVEKTSRILDELKIAGVNATFFCIGKNISNHADVIKRIIAEGHLIGNHSYAHDHLFDLKNKKEFIADINSASAEIKKLTGKTPKYFRPPYGVTTPALAKAVRYLGLSVIGWNLRSFDTKLKEPAKILTRIKKKLRPGSIILLHDTVDGTELVIRELLNYLRTENYKVVPLDQLIKKEPYA